MLVLVGLLLAQVEPPDSLLGTPSPGGGARILLELPSPEAGLHRSCTGLSLPREVHGILDLGKAPVDEIVVDPLYELEVEAFRDQGRSLRPRDA
jgi:hypothetical protein